MTLGRLSGPAGVLVAVALTASCGSEGTRIIAAYGEPDGHELELTIDSCNARIVSTDVEEIDEAIKILVVTDETETRDECANPAWITLEDPVGSREVIDRSTGERVAVERPDG
jgi:hypothetical protein